MRAPLGDQRSACGSVSTLSGTGPADWLWLRCVAPQVAGLPEVKRRVRAQVQQEPERLDSAIGNHHPSENRVAGCRRSGSAPLSSPPRRVPSVIPRRSRTDPERREESCRLCRVDAGAAASNAPTKCCRLPATCSDSPAESRTPGIVRHSVSSSGKQADLTLEASPVALESAAIECWFISRRDRVGIAVDGRGRRGRRIRRCGRGRFIRNGDPVPGRRDVGHQPYAMWIHLIVWLAPVERAK